MPTGHRVQAEFRLKGSLKMSAAKLVWPKIVCNVSAEIASDKTQL
jgi:hypothetical protein